MSLNLRRSQTERQGSGGEQTERDDLSAADKNLVSLTVADSSKDVTFAHWLFNLKEGRHPSKGLQENPYPRRAG